MEVLIVADAAGRGAGHLLSRLEARGADLAWLERGALHRPWTGTAQLVVLLGSRHAAHDPRRGADVAAEEDIVRVAAGSGRAVMGIGYGAHIAARALGGASYEADRPDIAWRRIDTVDDVLCPEGPWAHLHRDVFVPPPSARVLGSTWHGPQCFVDESWPGRVIAWQFHPEATQDSVREWLRSDADLVRSNGADVEALLAQTRRLAAPTTRAAHALLDAALDYLVGEPWPGLTERGVPGAPR